METKWSVITKRLGGGWLKEETEFFDNLDKGRELKTIWDASKDFMRFFLSNMIELKKKSFSFFQATLFQTQTPLFSLHPPPNPQLFHSKAFIGNSVVLPLGRGLKEEEQK